MLDGEAHRLGGFGKIRSASIEESPTACAFVLPGKDIVVRGRVSAPKKDFVGWVYADPKGPEHNTLNCSVADLELTVERPAQPARAAHPRGRRRLRARDARDRPRHPDPALPGRLSWRARRRRAATGWIWVAVVPIARSGRSMRGFGLERGYPLVAADRLHALRRRRRAPRRRASPSRSATGRPPWSAAARPRLPRGRDRCPGRSAATKPPPR